MGLKIKASSLLEKRSLEVVQGGVVYTSGAVLSSPRSFTFGEIDYVMLSMDDVLSLQAGQEMISIQTRPGKPEHAQVIKALLRGLRNTADLE